MPFIDPIAPIASAYLWISGLSFLLVYGIPLLFFPLQWARVFRWTLPAETHLTLYFARCLGALAITLIVMVFRAAPEAHKEPNIFLHIGLAGVAMTLVHVWGALRKQQPWTETVEIALYLTLAISAFYLRHSLGTSGP